MISNTADTPTNQCL